MSEAACKAVICGNKATQKMCEVLETSQSHIETAISWIDNGGIYPDLHAQYIIQVEELKLSMLEKLQDKINAIPVPNEL